MIINIPKTEVPVWLSSDRFIFDIDKILEDSVYYPSSAFDGEIVKLFLENSHSFVYVDYDCTLEDLDIELVNHGFAGYKVIHREHISKFMLSPKTRRLETERYQKYIFTEIEEKHAFVLKNFIKPYFAEWFVFENTENPQKRFSFLFVCNEAVSTYNMLYISRYAKPLVLVNKCDGGGFGGGWTKYGRVEEPLGTLISQNLDLLPDYFMSDLDDWPWYDNLVRIISPQLSIRKKELETKDYQIPDRPLSNPNCDLLGPRVTAPDWLYTRKFNLKKILENSLYYPASGFDGSMVRLFRGAIYSFVHVDYQFKRDQLLVELSNKGFKDFNMIYQIQLVPDHIVPNSYKFNKGSSQLSQIGSINPFCEWMIFENQNHERFALLHICAEGVAAYDDLYGRYKIAPHAIAFSRSDGFASNWTRFATKVNDLPNPMEEAVFVNKKKFPKYMIVDRRHDWEKYTTLVGQVDGLVIWKTKE